MTNHVQFLVADDPASISNTMKVVGSQYACYVNRVYHRTGTLWEGRHRSSLMDADNYPLICQRYVDLNPVRAQVVSHAADYPWSSGGCNALGDSSWVSPHRVFLLLAREAKQCCATDLALNPETIQIIRTATHFSQPIGAEAFRQGIEQRFGLRRGYSSHGWSPAVANAAWLKLNPSVPFSSRPFPRYTCDAVPPRCYGAAARTIPTRRRMNPWLTCRWKTRTSLRGRPS